MGFQAGGGAEYQFAIQQMLGSLAYAREMLPWSKVCGVPPAVAMMPRLPGQPPALEVEPLVLFGAVLDETTVAETGFFTVETFEDEEGVVGSTATAEVVAGIGITVTVEGEEDGVSDGEATVASTREVETASGSETGTEGTSEEVVSARAEVDGASVEDVSATLGAEKVELLVTPVKTLEKEDSLEAGNTMLEDGITSVVLR